MAYQPEDPKLRKASHIGLWFLVICIGGWLIWSATHTNNKKTANSFATGSKQSNIYHITRNYALASLNLALLPLTMHGCVKADKIDSVPADESTNDVIDTKQIVNIAKEEYQ